MRMLCICMHVLWLVLVLGRVNFNAIVLRIPILSFTCFYIPFLSLVSVSLLQGTQSRMASVEPPLPQGAGYGVLLGLGLFFAVSMVSLPSTNPNASVHPDLHPQIGTTYILRRFKSERQTSEMFTTAGRSAKSGLVGSAVVSSWTWAATLLQSTGVCYRYGVSGPFWYASGATVQILLFATLAVQLKRRAPNAHTFLEVVRARYGGATHAVFIVFGLMTSESPCPFLLSPVYVRKGTEGDWWTDGD